MIDNLRSRTTYALSWSIIERIGQQSIQLAISVVLARLLMPEQFGLLAMLTIFIAIAQSLVDAGFGLALIQKQDSNELDECSIFYLNIAFGFLAAALLFLGAPWIASFYNAAILEPLTQALSLNLIINAFGIVHVALLMKRIEFRTNMKINVIASVLSGGVGITMAYGGYGVWSLATQSITGSLARTFLLWFFVRWHPVWKFSFQSIKIMFSFGSKMLFSNMLDQAYNNLLPVIIGKMYSAADLGYYTRARSLQQTPVNAISDSVARVTFPIFSNIQNDKPRLKRGVKKALANLVMVNFPFMLGLAIVAKPLVLLLLTERWLPCVPYIQLLCILGLLYPLHVINLNALMAQGRSDLFLRLEVLKKIIALIIIFITYRWGISIMIFGQIIVSVMCYVINSHYTGKFLDYPIMEQVHDLIHSLTLSTLMTCCIYTLNFLSINSHSLLLILQIISGIVLYITLCWFTKLPSFMESLLLIKPKLKHFCGTS
jgi:O-antigen/teichoic acid export membrane protein